MKNDLRLIRMSDVQPEEVNWLWYPYIPFGKLTIIQGDSGEGKTTFVLAVISALTKGDALPERDTGEPVNVIYQTAEDGLADTIRPRLDALGADCSRVLVIDESRKELSLSDERIKQAIEETDAKLIVLDPLQAYLGADVDMHRANEVRPILKRLGAVAQRTGCTVVSDFRGRDMAAGGHGAPLVPYVDMLLLSHPALHRAVQNIGGIGNVTYLPPQGHEGAFGFDTGPGNMLMDFAAGELTGGKLRYDKDGALAASGRVCEKLLQQWMADSYFDLKPPKSTGREYFGVQMGSQLLKQCREEGLSDGDIMATITALTAESIADAYRRHLPQLPDEALLCGGGSRNPTLHAMISQRLPGCRVTSTDEAGLRSDAKEAAAFAILAYETMNRRPGNLPAATGAAEPVILGSVTYGR